MENSQKLKIHTYSKLSKEKLLEVRAFVNDCQKIDGYPARFYWENIENRQNKSINEILCYNQERLIAYIALYHFDEKEVEVTLMVHPDYRTTGLYNVLWSQLKSAMTRFSIDIHRYLLTCHQQFYSFKDYLRRLGGECAEWTYCLMINPKLYAKSQIDALSMTVRWRLATPADISTLVAIEIDNFQLEPAVYEAHIRSILENKHKSIWIAELNQQVVAKVHVEHNTTKQALLYDFCMPKQAQHQQYDVALVQALLKQLFDESYKTIRVEVTDEYDLHWYKRLNFQCVETYEHWYLRPYVSPLRERVKQLDTLLLNFNCYQTQDPSPFVVYKH